MVLDNRLHKLVVIALSDGYIRLVFILVDQLSACFLHVRDVERTVVINWQECFLVVLRKKFSV
jgi:hypothetical protein